MVLIYNYSYMLIPRIWMAFSIFTPKTRSGSLLWGYIISGSVLRTPDAMRRFLETRCNSTAEGIQSRHFLTNLAISRTGPRLAKKGTAMFVVTHQAYNQPQGTAVVVHTGEYKYQFVKTHSAGGSVGLRPM